MSKQITSMEMREAFPVSKPAEKIPIQNIGVSDEMDKLKQIPILDVLTRLGVEVNRQNFIVENGEVTSASVNIKENYINRFSGKEGSGTTIDACIAYGKMDTKGAIEYLKNIAGVDSLLSTVNPTEDKIDEINENPFTWGTEELDKKISPIETHHYNIIAGSTGAGKTAYAFDMATKNAKLGHKILYITLEMTTDGIYTRIAREYAGITKELWRKKSLISKGQLTAYKRRKKELQDMDNLILIGMTDNPSIEKIHEVIKKVKPDLTYIDNFDKIEVDKKLHVVQAQTEISSKILAICEKTPTPIIVIHHVKKGDDSSFGKQKSIDSLRGSGKIGHDAYTIIMAYRSPFKEELSAEEKAKFTIIEIKDREFGTGGYHICYFRRGKFEDKFVDDSISYAEQVFNTNAR